MKSNVCKIENGTKDLDAILKESEKVAVYNDLTHKQALQLRLICEEIDGMLPNIIDDFSGDFWIDFEDGVCKVNASIQIPEFNTEKKEKLIGIAKDKKNASAVGIAGKIRDAIENFFLDETTSYGIAASSSFFHLSTGFSEGVDYSYLWSLENYRYSVKGEEKSDDWDELERSVIASVADDVIVGVKGKHAGITVVKKFV
jgi:hypothetical protein